MKPFKPRTHTDFRNEVNKIMGLGPVVAQPVNNRKLAEENAKLKRELGRAKAKENAAKELYNATVTKKDKKTT